MINLEDIKKAIISAKRKDAIEFTKQALDEGADPQEIIDGYLIPGLEIVGERFQKRQCFVPEMMLAAKSMQACIDLIKPLIQQESEKKLGTVVIGTVFGDLHDIGKNLVKLLLESSGFNVIDLGENITPEKFVETGIERKVDVVGLSSLLTTGDPYVKKTVEAIRNSELKDTVKIICGGAALTPKFVLETCGADAYAKDAADGVKQIKKLIGVDGK